MYGRPPWPPLLINRCDEVIKMASAAGAVFPVTVKDLLLQGLARHLNHEFDYLFTYLKHPGLEATNWRGEQAIRPAVVTRKVWGGNRNEQGAHTQEVLMSVLRTLRQRKLEPLPLLANLLRSTQPYVLPLPRTPVPT